MTLQHSTHRWTGFAVVNAAGTIVSYASILSVSGPYLLSSAP